MNDRLLKISATLFPVDIEGNTYATSEKIMEFAELIVRECASKITRNEALNIFEHFGVKE